MESEKDNKKAEEKIDGEKDNKPWMDISHTKDELHYKDSTSSTRKGVQDNILESDMRLKSTNKALHISESAPRNIGIKSTNLSVDPLALIGPQVCRLPTPTLKQRRAFGLFNHVHNIRSEVCYINMLYNASAKRPLEANWLAPKNFSENNTLKKNMSNALEHPAATLSREFSPSPPTFSDSTRQTGTIFIYKNDLQKCSPKMKKFYEDPEFAHPHIFCNMKLRKDQKFYRLEKGQSPNTKNTTPCPCLGLRIEKESVNANGVKRGGNIKAMHREVAANNSAVENPETKEKKVRKQSQEKADMPALQEYEKKNSLIRPKSIFPEGKTGQLKEAEEKVAKSGHLELKGDSNHFDGHSHKDLVGEEVERLNKDKTGSETRSRQDTMHYDKSKAQETSELNKIEENLSENEGLSKDGSGDMGKTENAIAETYPEQSGLSNSEDNLMEYEANIKCMQPQEYEGILGIIKMKRIFRDHLYNRKGYKYKSEFQVKVLNDILRITPYPNAEVLDAIGVLLNLKPRSVQIWFQNARQAGETQMNREQLKELRKTASIDTRQIFDIYLKNRDSMD